MMLRFGTLKPPAMYKKNPQYVRNKCSKAISKASPTTATKTSHKGLEVIPFWNSLTAGHAKADRKTGASQQGTTADEYQHTTEQYTENVIKATSSLASAFMDNSLVSPCMSVFMDNSLVSPCMSVFMDNSLVS
jgi:hypothetical protein